MLQFEDLKIEVDHKKTFLIEEGFFMDNYILIFKLLNLLIFNLKE